LQVRVILSNLLTCCMLRPIQPPTFYGGMEMSSSLRDMG